MKCDRKKFIISKDIVNVTGALKYMFINLTLWFLHMVRPWVEKYGFNYISIDLEMWPKNFTIFHKQNLNFVISGLQRRQRRVLDTSNTYVRGEENLRGWRPQVFFSCKF